MCISMLSTLEQDCLQSTPAKHANSSASVYRQTQVLEQVTAVRATIVWGRLRSRYMQLFANVHRATGSLGPLLTSQLGAGCRSVSWHARRPGLEAAFLARQPLCQPPGQHVRDGLDAAQARGASHRHGGQGFGRVPSCFGDVRMAALLLLRCFAAPPVVAHDKIDEMKLWFAMCAAGESVRVGGASEPGMPARQGCQPGSAPYVCQAPLALESPRWLT